MARVHERITLLTPPLRARRLRRAVGFAASVLVAFLAGFFGAGGGMFLGRGGVNPIERVHALASGGGTLLPGAPSPGAAPVKPPDARSPADRLRALLAPLGTPAALEPATISAWKKATRDPDPTLRAVARALLRASESPLDAEPRPPPGSALIDLEVPDEPPVGERSPGRGAEHPPQRRRSSPPRRRRSRPGARPRATALPTSEAPAAGRGAQMTPRGPRDVRCLPRGARRRRAGTSPPWLLLLLAASLACAREARAGPEDARRAWEHAQTLRAGPWRLRLAALREARREANRTDPMEVRTLLAEAKLLESIGHAAAARVAEAAAVALSPRHDPSRLSRLVSNARELLAEEDAVGARPLLEEARVLGRSGAPAALAAALPCSRASPPTWARSSRSTFSPTKPAPSPPSIRRRACASSTSRARSRSRAATRPAPAVASTRSAAASPTRSAAAATPPIASAACGSPSSSPAASIG